MKLHKMSCFSITLFLVASGLGSINNVSQVGTLATTLYVGGSGPGNYTSIQNAIDNASSGDTVFVYTGIYYEHITINKLINLIGEDRDNTIIDGGGSGRVIYSYGSDVTIKEFTVQNGSNSAGTSKNSCIEVLARDNTICDINIKNSYYGIHLFASEYCVIDNVTVSNAIQDGIYIEYSHYITIKNNTIQSCYNGIYLESSKNNIINNNDVFNNEIGIYLHRLSDSNIFSENNICQNSNFGIYIDESNTNEFYHNNFINNTNHVYTYRSSNSWDNGYPSGGNYWDDYTGSDNFYGPNQNITGSDEIGDIPYSISGVNNQDNYPFMNPDGWLNSPPVADANGPYEAEVGEQIQLDGTGSYDTDGSIISYEWDLDDDGEYDDATGATPTHIWYNAGTYTISLKVTDDESATDTNDTTVEIIDSNDIDDDGDGYTENQGDCDDTNPNISPGADEQCYDGIDNDCDGLIDTDDPDCQNGYTPFIILLDPVENKIIKDTITIKWTAHDSEDGDDLPIYLYLFDSDNDMTTFSNNPYDNTGELAWDTTVYDDGLYKLLIEAQDNDGNIGHDSCSFTIKNHEETENNAPLKPAKPTGPASGKPDVEYSYSTTTNDPDGDQIWYNWDFGDSSTSGWLGPYNTGETCEIEHQWSSEGEYSIKVKAKDEHGKESTWSDPLQIEMPKTYTNPILLLILKVLERYPFLHSLLFY